MMNAGRRQTRRRATARWASLLLSLFIIHHSSFIISSVLADSVWVTTAGSSAALELPHVQIKTIEDGRLVFVGASGHESNRDLAQVARITVDDDPNLNAAEDAANQQKWDAATDAYRRVATTSGKPWARLWALQRLVTVAQKANRFDTAAEAYVALVQTDPTSAAALKLTLPDQRSTFLTTALANVTQALNDPKLSPEQRKLLLEFQLQLEQARKDTAAAAQTGEQILRSSAATPGGDANASAQLAKLKLDQAAADLQARQYQKVIGDIKSASATFTEPRDQAQALYMLADGTSGLAGSVNTVPAWQDAALAYMRVVAHFKETPAAAPLVAKAMLRAGQIEEQLKDRDAARTLYEQLLAQYPRDPSAPDAQAGLDRLKAGR